MRKLLPIILVFTTGCATIHRHPTLTKVTIISAAAGTGVIVGNVTRRSQECPSTINGYPYNGTPTGGKRPEYWPTTRK